MALMHAFHFESRVMPPNFYIPASSASISTTQKRTGSYSLQVSSSVSGFQYGAICRLGTLVPEIYLQFCFRAINPVYQLSPRFFRWQSLAGNVLGGLAFNSGTYMMELYTGNFATLVGTSSIPFPLSVWTVVELHILLADSGIIECRLNSIPAVSFSGNTRLGDTPLLASVDFGYGGESYGFYDDIIINDTSGTTNNTWPGGAKVFYSFLTGDGATKQWSVTPAGLTHYTAIDEVPPVSTDNIRAGTTNLVDSFTVTALPSNAGSVMAVIPEAYVFRGTIGVPSRLALGVEMDGNAFYSSDLELSLSQAPASVFITEKPGGGAITATDFNNMKLLIKSAP
jgi:hypothetical protein